MSKEPLLWLCTLGCCLLALGDWGCVPQPGPGDGGLSKDAGPSYASRRPDKDYAKIQMTEDDGCEVKLEFEGHGEWPPMNERLNLRVILSKKDGSTDGEFAIDINELLNDRRSELFMATMPEHGHGLEYLPKLSRIDNHTFRISGVLFHMEGWWKIAFRVIKGCTKPTRVAFNTYVEPEPVDLSKISTDTPVVFKKQEFPIILSLSPLQGLPDDPTNKYANDDKAAHLGRYLFYDKRLSKNASGGGEVSCATCHDPQKGWSDGRELSKGVADLGRHSPNLWNVAYNRWFFWDGRADSLWSQALKPVEDGNEMAGNRYRILRLFVEDADLTKAYKAVFGSELPKDVVARYTFTDAKPMSDENDPMHKNWASMDEADQTKVNRFYSNIGKAIAAFERKIVSRGSPFDEFVSGIRDKKPEKFAALSASAQRGLKLFIQRDSCVACHSGPHFSDGEFHNLGLPKKREDSGAAGRSKGLLDILKDVFGGLGPFSDKPDPDVPVNQKLKHLAQTNPHALGQFKTPGLRHIAETAPYMHDGRFKDLKEVIKFYSHFGVPDDQVSKCKKEARANTKPIAGSSIQSQDEGCPMDTPELGFREEFLRLWLFKDSEIDDLVNFLKSLTGKELPAELLKPPASPIP